MSPTRRWEDRAVLEFFETSGATCLPRKGRRRSPSHRIVGGRNRAPAGAGYFRGKLAQENDQGRRRFLTIVRATQFFEFVDGIAQSARSGRRFGCRLR